MTLERSTGLRTPAERLPEAGFRCERYHAFPGNALLLDRIHKTAFRRFGRQRRQQQTGGCYVGRWKFHCVDRAFRVPPFRFWTEKKQETFFRFPAWYAAV